MTDRTYGPAYDPAIDEPRVAKQHERIRDYMLARGDCGQWMTLAEIAEVLDYPEASISAQLRHLRKPRFGAYIVDKRRRTAHGGTWEYQVTRPPPPPTADAVQQELSLGRD